jgi:hypothetical protein
MAIDNLSPKWTPQVYGLLLPIFIVDLNRAFLIGMGAAEKFF